MCWSQPPTGHARSISLASMLIPIILCKLHPDLMWNTCQAISLCLQFGQLWFGCAILYSCSNAHCRFAFGNVNAHMIFSPTRLHCLLLHYYQVLRQTRHFVFVQCTALSCCCSRRADQAFCDVWPAWHVNLADNPEERDATCSGASRHTLGLQAN